MSYKPKKRKNIIVLLLSTLHSDESLCDNGKPEIIDFYNQNKTGVDRLDQLCGNYTCGRATRRWPLCLFYCIFDFAGVDSHIVLSHYFPDDLRSKNRKEFIKSLGMDLIINYIQKRSESKCSPIELRTTINRVLDGNQSSETVSPQNKRPKIRANNSRCDQCLSEEVRRRSTIRCQKCGHLCCMREHLYSICSECFK